ncbi:acid protease [Acephala macrosclerotiorum]|nr:acid protease [Acephala macrosclerotiorum]
MILTTCQGFINVLHAVNLSTGNPPQVFRAVLDFGDSELLIPSIQTPGNPEDPVPHRYNHFLSETYKQNGTLVVTSQLWGAYRGNLSQDDFHLSEIQIPAMLFQEASDMRHRQECGGLCDIPYDTVFPLAPFNASFEHNFMSPLARLVQNEILDENIFSLCLSRGPTDNTDWLLLGTRPSPGDGYDPEDSFKIIQASDLPVPELPYFTPHQPGNAQGDRWKVQIDSFSFGDHPDIHKEYTKPTVAVVEVFRPFIGLPNTMREAINQVLGADTWGPMAWLNCSMRDELPDVTIVLAGEEFVLTAYDYSLEQWDDESMEGRIYCMNAFLPVLEEDQVVLLGSAFLRPLITVWDLEKRMMSYVKTK